MKVKNTLKILGWKMNLLLKKKTFCKENIEKVEILERETAKAILEAKEIDFSKPYYEEHNL